MRYEFVSMQEVGHQENVVVRLQQIPNNWWDRLCRRSKQELLFFGHDDRWNTFDTTQLDPRINEFLCDTWREHCDPR